MNEQKEVMARVKEAMERVRTGESESEDVELPSGDRVRILPDQDAPGGIAMEPLDGEGNVQSRREMGPEWKEAGERIKEASERIRSGESDSEEITLPDGETMRLLRDPEIPGAFVVESSQAGNTLRAVTYEAAPTRPKGYPDDLPFLPGCPCSVTIISGEDARSVSWFAPPEPELALESVGAQLVGDGWEKQPESKVSHPFGKSRALSYRKGQSTTNLLLNEADGKAHLMLMQGADKTVGEGMEIPWR